MTTPQPFDDDRPGEDVDLLLGEGETAAEETPPPPAAAGRPVKDLPPRPRPGLTHSVRTPIGRVHVTLNVDPDRPTEPFDVFITLSKAGSDTNADVDAIGRLLSLICRFDVPIPARTRLELAVEQLRGIATTRSVGFGPRRVRSGPDGVAVCLEVLLEALDDGAIPAPAPRLPDDAGAAAGQGEAEVEVGEGAEGESA